jgi:flagellar biosynthesis protein FlhB
VEDKHSKTEQATPKRLSDSKKKGQVAKSADFNSAVSFLVFALFLGALGQHLFSNSMEFMRAMLQADFVKDMSAGDAGGILMKSVESILMIFLPFGLLAVVLGVVTNIIQVGFIFTAEPLKPDFKRLNPVEGFKNIFSAKSMFKLVKSLLKLIIVSLVAYQGLKKIIMKIINSGQMGIENIFTFFISIVSTISINIAALMIVLGVVDFIFQRREFKKNLMMTKQEVKEEYKQMEGDPKVKAARQQRQRQLSMNRTMQNVEEATVVITNPTHIAIALRYKQGEDRAPVVMAKGLDYMAQKIKDTAKEKGIPVIENKPLARAMYPSVKEGSFVPMELYQAIAEVLAMVYQMEKKNKRKI